MAVLPFRSVLDFAANFRKSGEKRVISGIYPDADSLQMRITAKRLEIEKKIQRLEAIDAEANFDTLFGQKSKYINCTVSEYFRQQIEYLKGYR